jgi:hypothetical protein
VAVRDVSKPQQLIEKRGELYSTCIPSTKLALAMQTALFYSAAAFPRANPTGKGRARKKKVRREGEGPHQNRILE